MKRGYLSQYFTAVAGKRLSPVEIDGASSNQHEFNGASAFRKILGAERRELSTKFLYLGNDGEEISINGQITWYDAREQHPTRSEHRLYYSAGAAEIVESAVAGDLLVIALKEDNQALAIIAPQGSTVEQQILWLFDIEINGSFTLKDETEIEKLKLGTAAKTILEQLGIDAVETNENFLDLILGNFGAKFPSTAEFSTFARKTLQVEEIDALRNPDQTILAVYERENVLFKTLEKHLLKAKIENGFSDVDEFIGFSLQVQNRRKSRAGHALENHLQYIFDQNRIKYSKGQVTERGNKPDFIFPGIEQYKNASFPDNKLTFLGAKTSCKDRWRQVQPEADRISLKHLFTIEPSISKQQTDQMCAEGVQLVLPQELHGTYSDVQKAWLLNLKSFLMLVQERQGK